MSNFQNSYTTGQPTTTVNVSNGQSMGYIPPSTGGFTYSVTSPTATTGLYQPNIGYAGSPNIGYANSILTTNTQWISNSSSIPPGATIELKGENADIVVNGKSMMKILERIEERLSLLTPNQSLEEDWEELADLGRKYKELEKNIKEKMVTWDKLNADYSKK